MIEAISDKVVVLIPEIGKTSGGLYVPEGTEDVGQDPSVEVVSVGPDVQSGIKKGDRVYCAPPGNEVGGLMVLLNGRKYVLMSEKHIYGVRR